MKSCKFDKDIVFYIPGETGTKFTFAAHQDINPAMLLQTQEFLVQEEETPVLYIQDRRSKKRY